MHPHEVAAAIADVKRDRTTERWYGEGEERVWSERLRQIVKIGSRVGEKPWTICIRSVRNPHLVMQDILKECGDDTEKLREAVNREFGL